MTDVPEPTLELLSRLLGKRVAKQLYRGSLTDLFLSEDTPADAKLQLQASRKLVQRWLLEDLRRNPVLASPRVVREYLAVYYAGHEREVFGCLFLDTRHRLIAVEEMFLGNRRWCVRAPPRCGQAGPEAQCRRGDPGAQPSERCGGAQHSR